MGRIVHSAFHLCRIRTDASQPQCKVVVSDRWSLQLHELVRALRSRRGTYIYPRLKLVLLYPHSSLQSQPPSLSNYLPQLTATMKISTGIPLRKCPSSWNTLSSLAVPTNSASACATHLLGSWSPCALPRLVRVGCACRPRLHPPQQRRAGRLHRSVRRADQHRQRSQKLQRCDAMC